uniref:Uncharacterized protein n=1 Tax=Oryza brachyantha TaxID=4533 RepID=J3LVU8_ORYBR
MKLLPLLLLTMVIANTCTVTSHMASWEEPRRVMKMTMATVEGTSIDNHHAIPRPEYDSWSSPGNMPGGGHDIGSQEANP